jgi:CysZ protein
MSDLGRALADAGRSLVQPAVLLIVFVPMLAALLLWLGIAVIWWDTWTSMVQAAIVQHGSFGWTANWDLTAVASWIATATVLALLLPMIIITALLIATVFAMPLLVRHVARRDFPTLEMRHGGSILGSTWNALAAIFVFVLLWIVTLPLWLLGPLAAVLPLALSAYLNQRLFRYDAVSDHADAQEMRRLFQLARGRLFVLGLITGLLYFIPPINLIAPIFAALAYIHFCLRSLQQMRTSEIEIDARRA